MSQRRKLILGMMAVVLLVPLLFVAIMADSVFGELFLLSSSLLIVLLIIAVVVWMVG